MYMCMLHNYDRKMASNYLPAAGRAKFGILLDLEAMEITKLIC